MKGLEGALVIARGIIFIIIAFLAYHGLFSLVSDSGEYGDSNKYEEVDNFGVGLRIGDLCCVPCSKFKDELKLKEVPQLNKSEGVLARKGL